MDAVMLSIQPKWVEKILNGEKTVDVRKSKPKLQVPFKCYIYETQGKSKDLGVIGHSTYLNRQKVVAEFTCNEVYQYSTANCDGQTISKDDIERMSRLTHKQLSDYEFSADAKDYCIYNIGIYGWHIYDLVVYDKSKELSEFKQCHKCEYGDRLRCNEMEFSCNGSYNLTRPPQSWCYVEEMEEWK